jgi:hypothetical protein
VNEGTCKTCGAAIVWVVTGKGAKMPVDKLAERKFVLEPNPMGADAPQLAYSRPVYTSHFVTCPDRDQHRRGA